TFPSTGEIVVEDFERLVPQELLWVKGQADTTFVVGEGIGPDLSVPVPYAMVRRTGTDATFDVLHAPHGSEGPTITDLSVLPCDAPESDSATGYLVSGSIPATGAGFSDVLLLVGRGAGSTERSFGDYGSDGIFAWARSSSEGELTHLVLAEATSLADATRDLFRAPQPLASVAFAITPPAVEILSVDGEIADSRLLAPETSQVTYQGSDVTFTQDGDYVVFGSLTGVGGGGGAGAGASDDDSGCGCAVPGTDDPAYPLGTLFALLLAGMARRRRPLLARLWGRPSSRSRRE
ncbi:MAG: hypothetical protein DRI90_28640, partial [Deltaproteobacteria bacterium]